MDNNKYLEIPEKEVFVRGGRLGCKTESEYYLVPEPEVIGITELREAMISRGWLCDDHDIYDPRSGKFYRKRARTMREISEDYPIPSYKVNENSFVPLEHPELQVPDPKFGDADAEKNYLSKLSEYTSLFNKYIMIKEDNIGEYNNIISSRDILEGTSEVCLICPKDGCYTNIINLNSIQGNPVQLRVGVAYSKGQELFSRDMVIPTLDSADYITTGPREFKLEYSDGCLRVFPNAPEVTECVISYCYLTYEYLI